MSSWMDLLCLLLNPPFSGLLVSISTTVLFNRVNKYLQETRVTQPKTTAKDPYLSWKWRNFLISFVHSFITGIGSIVWYDCTVFLNSLYSLDSSCYCSLWFPWWWCCSRGNNMINTQYCSQTSTRDWHVRSSEHTCLLSHLFFPWILYLRSRGVAAQPGIQGFSRTGLSSSLCEWRWLFFLHDLLSLQNVKWKVSLNSTCNFWHIFSEYFLSLASGFLASCLTKYDMPGDFMHEYQSRTEPLPWICFHCSGCRVEQRIPSLETTFQDRRKRWIEYTLPGKSMG